MIDLFVFQQPASPRVHLNVRTCRRPGRKEGTLQGEALRSWKWGTAGTKSGDEALWKNTNWDLTEVCEQISPALANSAFRQLSGTLKLITGFRMTTSGWQACPAGRAICRHASRWF